MAELRDIGFKVFLDLLGKIAKPKATHLVIPFDNRSGIFLRRVLTDPVIDFLFMCSLAMFIILQVVLVSIWLRGDSSSKIQAWRCWESGNVSQL